MFRRQAMVLTVIASATFPAAAGAQSHRHHRANRAHAAADVPAHVATWAYDDGCNGGTGATAALVQGWVSYAESNCGASASKALTDCHGTGRTECTAVAYLDTNKIYGDSVPIAQSAQEGWWLHVPGYGDQAHRLRTSDFGGGYLLNQRNPAVRGWFRNYVQTKLNSYDALMMDDTNASLAAELFDTGQTRSDEITTDAALRDAHEAMASAVTHANGSPLLQIDNGLNVNPYLPTPFGMLNKPSAVNGLIAEGEPMSNGTMTGYYSTLLDDLAYVDHTSNDFIVLLSYDASGALRARRVQAATTLLGYKTDHVVSWSDLEQNSDNLAVWPEQGLVPTRPVQTMGAPTGSGCLAGTGRVCARGGHNDLQVAPGVYRREFAACFNHGSAIGKCAVIVNTTGGAVTIKRAWLTQRYSHQITFVGGDVQSGGTIDVAGAPLTAGATAVGAHDASLLAG